MEKNSYNGPSAPSQFLFVISKFREDRLKIRSKQQYWGETKIMEQLPTQTEELQLQANSVQANKQNKWVQRKQFGPPVPRRIAIWFDEQESTEINYRPGLCYLDWERVNLCISMLIVSLNSAVVSE